MVPKNVGLLHHRTLVNRSHTPPDAIHVLNEPRRQAASSEYANCPYNPCLCTSPDGVACIEPISCDAVPKHFQMHGIKGLMREAVITCRWQGCQLEISRHNYTRHIRERHLGHVRGVGHEIQTSADLDNTKRK
ncbi:hypothetical protein EDD16DRAFT_1523783 [Pisolithus croceorrhizus]|nr:hypothetical protein EDD16DRAFT_1523783 [Pisolithus croceorrhizus]